MSLGQPGTVMYMSRSAMYSYVFVSVSPVQFAWGRVVVARPRAVVFAGFSGFLHHV